MMTRDLLETLTTKRLLAYKSKWMKIHETADWDHPTGFSKQSPRWTEHLNEIKAILSKREHIE